MQRMGRKEKAVRKLHGKQILDTSQEPLSNSRRICPGSRTWISQKSNLLHLTPQGSTSEVPAQPEHTLDLLDIVFHFKSTVLWKESHVTGKECQLLVDSISYLTASAISGSKADYMRNPTWLSQGFVRMVLKKSVGVLKSNPLTMLASVRNPLPLQPIHSLLPDCDSVPQKCTGWKTRQCTWTSAEVTSFFFAKNILYPTQKLTQMSCWNHQDILDVMF